MGLQSIILLLACSFILSSVAIECEFPAICNGERSWLNVNDNFHVHEDGEHSHSYNCSAELRPVKAQLHQMDLKLTALTEAITTLSNQMSRPECGTGQVQFGSQCFKIIQGRNTFAQADQICRGSGGKPADITSRPQYEFLMGTIRNIIPSGYSEFWIGLRFDPPTATVTLSNGQPAPYVKWWSRGHPFSRGATHTNVYFWLAKNPNSASGMAEWDPVQKRIGVICQYSPVVVEHP